MDAVQAAKELKLLDWFCESIKWQNEMLKTINERLKGIEDALDISLEAHVCKLDANVLADGITDLFHQKATCDNSQAVQEQS